MPVYKCRVIKMTAKENGRPVAYEQWRFWCPVCRNEHGHTGRQGERANPCPSKDKVAGNYIIVRADIGSPEARDPHHKPSLAVANKLCRELARVFGSSVIRLQDAIDISEHDAALRSAIEAFIMRPVFAFDAIRTMSARMRVMKTSISGKMVKAFVCAWDGHYRDGWQFSKQSVFDKFCHE